VARNGERTHKAIMDAAEELIMAQGYSATAIDQIIARAGITKGTFFYHFPTKADLAHELAERYARRDTRQLAGKMEAAEQATPDPALQLLLFLEQFIDIAEQWTTPYPGCLFASFCYEAGLFEDRTTEVMRDSMLVWRTRIADKLRAAAAARSEPRLPVDADSLADAVTVVFEGAFIVSRTLDDARIVAQQLRHLQNYLRLLFGLEDAAIGRAA
jgi:TetR/AcrR family transcriptional repressor of nem operon